MNNVCVESANKFDGIKMKIFYLKFVNRVQTYVIYYY